VKGEWELSTKLRLIISSLLILGNLLFIFNSVNYKPDEFKLSMKSLLRQELTLDEIKSSDVYNAYKEITYNTSVDELNSILDKENENIADFIKSWHLPYGSVSVMLNTSDKPRIGNKVISFKTLYTTKITEKELDTVFKCNSFEEIINILGEPIIAGEVYNKDGEVTNYSYEWGIKTSYSAEFRKAIEEEYDNYVNLPMVHPLGNKNRGKFRLSASVKDNNQIEKITLSDY